MNKAATLLSTIRTGSMVTIQHDRLDRITGRACVMTGEGTPFREWSILTAGGHSYVANVNNILLVQEVA